MAKSGLSACAIATIHASRNAPLAASLGDDSHWANAQSVLRERRLISAELHDTVVQSLSQMKMRLALLEDELRAEPHGRAAQYAAEIRDALDRAYADARELMTKFRCQMDSRGLIEALGAVAESHQALTGVAFTVENRAGELPFDAEQQLQVFLIVQEALANIVRHAKAGSASLVIERDRGQLRIVIEDDGRGINVESSRPEHFGLDIMAERAANLGGELTVTARNIGGTRVQLLVPLEGKAG